MQSRFANDYVIMEYLDIGSWPLFSQKINLLGNIELEKKILDTYYNLQQLSRKIDRHFEMHFSTFRAMNSYFQDREHIKISSMGQIGELSKESEEILKELSKSA